MLRTFLFQLHWLLGITAGLILTVVGVTGGLLAFEQEILNLMNPGVMTVEVPNSKKLMPSELLAAIQRSAPDHRINGLTLYQEADRSAQVQFAGNNPGNRRGENRAVNPYSGDLLAEPRGVGFFRTVMQLHRWLLTDTLFDNRQVGKQVVGAATVGLILLTLTGLFLRWPKQVFSVKVWLGLSLKRRGRSLLWHLHAVLGTWALLLYLLAALTGLYWSYDWYRNALHGLSGVPAMAHGQPGPGQRSLAEGAPGQRRAGEGRQGRDGSAGRAPGGRGQAMLTPQVLQHLDRAWEVFAKEVGAHSRQVMMRLPQRGDTTITMTSLGRSARHDRATDRVVIDPLGQTIVEHDRFSQRPLKVRLMSSMLALHSGSCFGLPGRIIMAIASLGLPLFTLTGWMLYLQRRRNQRAAKVAAATVARGAESRVSMPPLLIGYASQSGTAERLAWQGAAHLQQAGMQVVVKPLGALAPSDLEDWSLALFLVSTFGDGVPPHNGRVFARAMADTQVDLSPLSYLLLSLGDRQYRQYCKFGRALDGWLQQQGARPRQPAVEVDDNDPAALALWAHALDQLADAAGGVRAGADLSGHALHCRELAA